MFTGKGDGDGNGDDDGDDSDDDSDRRCKVHVVIKLTSHTRYLSIEFQNLMQLVYYIVWGGATSSTLI